MKIFQHAELSDHPSLPMDAATKQYVDEKVNATGNSVAGGVFFTNIAPTSSGIVGQKQYVPNTVPANRVITEGTTDTANVRLSLIAEGSGSFYSPTITITSNPPLPNLPANVNLTEDPSDKRFFLGTIDLTGITDGDYVITATSSTGAEATTTIRRAGVGPSITTVIIGALPGSQTEAKAGDVIQVSGLVPNAATAVEIIAAGAAGQVSAQTLDVANSGGDGYRKFSGTFVASNLSGLQSVTARAQNALGTYGANRTSANQITLNQTYPTIGARSITYPGGQLALKDTENATVNATVTNADIVTYSSSADLSITNPGEYAASKTVSRAGGSYVVNTNNYTIIATKTSNNATSTAQAQVAIANTAPTAAIAIVGNPARLQSTDAGNDYTVRLTPNQSLLAAPTLVASSGTWQGSWVNNGGIWSRVLRIKDADPKGNQTFNSLVLVNLANRNGNQITAGGSYVVGGFPMRTITFPAFSRYQPIGTRVTDITKVSANYTNAATLTRYTDTDDHFQGFTIVDENGNYSPTGSYLYISDAAFAGSNTTGTLQLDVLESA
jgi:hypothetical protein